jgi:hypothetical protein
MVGGEAPGWGEEVCVQSTSPLVQCTTSPHASAHVGKLDPTGHGPRAVWTGRTDAPIAVSGACGGLGTQGTSFRLCSCKPLKAMRGALRDVVA